MGMDRRSVTMADASGTGYTGPLQGEIDAIYIDVGDQPSTIDVTITDNETGAAILTLTNVSASAWYPVRVGTVDQSGAARLYAASGTAVASEIPIAGDLKVVWAQGTAGHTATLYAFVEC